MSFSHGIACLDEIKIAKNDYYSVCVQTNEELYPEVVISPTTGLFGNEFDNKLYALHQIVLRSFSRVEDFIADFLETDLNK